MTRQLQPAEQLLGPALEATLDALDLARADAALIAHARRLAAAIDNGEGRGTNAGPPYPAFLAALTALGATPAARKLITTREGADRAREAPKSSLAQLRQARRA